MAQAPRKRRVKQRPFYRTNHPPQFTADEIRNGLVAVIKKLPKRRYNELLDAVAADQLEGRAD